MEFSKWIKWSERNNLSDINFPGIYIISFSNQNLDNTIFNWIKEIIYIGMTNSRGGLKNRLQQFENTISGKEGHGGAHRVMFLHNDYNTLVNNLYVSIHPFYCDVKSNKVEDLLLMGKVAEFEYICFAKYVERFGHLPEFNDKDRSPKK